MGMCLDVAEHSFSIESVIWGHHVYKEIWKSYIDKDEELVCKRQRHNAYDLCKPDDNSHQCEKSDDFGLKEVKQLRLCKDVERKGTHVWNSWLSQIDRGDWLTGKHINHAHSLIKAQFQIHSLQSTLLQKSLHLKPGM